MAAQTINPRVHFAGGPEWMCGFWHFQVTKEALPGHPIHPTGFEERETCSVPATFGSKAVQAIYKASPPDKGMKLAMTEYASPVVPTS